MEQNAPKFVKQRTAGAADGNVDTLSVIDLDASPPRVIDHVVVGDAPEGLAIGRFATVTRASSEWSAGSVSA
jgi:hypothetical protein